MTAALRSISYEIGELRSANALVEEGVSIEQVGELLDKGVNSYSVLNRSVAAAMSDCINTSLEDAGIAPADIDTVILVTESFATLFDEDAGTNGSFRAVRNRAFDYLAEMGIAKASILCATYGGCTNVLQALLLAQAIVDKGLGRNVLLVAAEKFQSVEERLMNEAISIAGDGVAACVIASGSHSEDSGTPGAFGLEYVSTAPYKAFQAQGDMASLLLEMFRALKNAAADTYEACRRQPAEFRWLVLGDYNRLTSLTYSRLLGFKPDSTFLRNVGKMGHIPFDPLINLCDLARSGEVSRGDRVLLFLCGPVSCGAVSLKAL